ncbi:RagB/SusD family nutrient uptake outer membrane protein [Flammeovirga yaeyamensis]|uniref:RagB/SusD family nutrient uptake outer membrane protein n=1 Tax=Flammeovirga yaeyamensis TaxID=367791 RepID=A0AAX1N883_9BACT|nr:RagB/SusD family nutrient uptake outer membrane protein [Flammeovirga yaeyamensis]MBB3698925.1 hypothetical protein [Flammeovirga yaeyamensis]NMF36360.1 RagB/SusD family nutrient uptake outer membrane protein [Flammeovirga yaeyamensis]QWG03679.1 RagB/SusD family nutrient uptake outer membrane protein [Flammeovirga yaeyamensis]
MKNIKNNIFILFLLVGLLNSCNLLDKEPLHAVTDETFWKNEAEARAFLNNNYNSLTPFWHLYLESASDNGYLKYAWEGSDLRDYTTGNHNAFTGFCDWWFDYKDIRNCYEFLAKIDEVPGVSPESNKEMKAETYFFLASKYFDMWKAYREVPLVDRLLTVQEADVPTSKEEEIKAFIEEHLDLAIEGLPETSAEGRLTKGAARMLKADYLIWNQDYQGVIEQTKAIINSGNYALEPHYEDLFHSSTQGGTKEVILWREYKNGVNADWDNYTNYMLLPNGFLGGWSSVAPTQDLVDAYEAKDGVYPFTDSPLYDAVNDKQGYTIRDPRFEQSILYNGTVYGGILYEPLRLDDNNPNVIGGNNCTVTGYNYRKYTDLDKISPSLCDVNNYIYRYAETLLFFAEAQNEVRGPSSEVYNAIDQVRERAGMPKVNQSIYNTQVAVRELIQRERRVEFAGEQKRFWDSWRWGMNQFGNPKHWTENSLQVDVESVEYEHLDGSVSRDFIRGRRNGSMGNRNYVLPIPQSALDVSRNITQHPAWR